MSKNKETNTFAVLVSLVKRDLVINPTHNLIVSKSSSKLLDVLTILDNVLIIDLILMLKISSALIDELRYLSITSFAVPSETFSFSWCT